MAWASLRFAAAQTYSDEVCFGLHDSASRSVYTLDVDPLGSETFFRDGVDPAVRGTASIAEQHVEDVCHWLGFEPRC